MCIASRKISAHPKKKYLKTTHLTVSLKKKFYGRSIHIKKKYLKRRKNASLDNVLGEHTVLLNCRKIIILIKKIIQIATLKKKWLTWQCAWWAHWAAQSCQSSLARARVWWLTWLAALRLKRGTSPRTRAPRCRCRMLSPKGLLNHFFRTISGKITIYTHTINKFIQITKTLWVI